MENLHNLLIDTIKNALRNYPDLSEELTSEFIKRVMDETVPKIATAVYSIMSKKAPSILKQDRKQLKKFINRNNKKWKDAFVKFEMFISLLVETGDEYHEEYYAKSIEEHNYVFEVLTRNFGRACQICNEILVLLKNGYPNGALARWRTLHEIAVISLFIKKYGNRVAERYINHQIVETYKGAKQYQQYCSILQNIPIDEKTLKQYQEEYNKAIDKYGDGFKTQYGWASEILNKKSPQFIDIEKNTTLDYQRPYYKMASHSIHANPKGIYFSMGLNDSSDDIILTGPSNEGFTDPAHCSAISLYHLCNAFFNIYPNIDRLVAINIFYLITEEIGDEFWKVQEIDDNLSV